jgi:hypothetical protein
MKLGTQSFGLCLGCVHVRQIESAKGSQFTLCKLSDTDSRFPKYPQLPVFTCSGFQSKAALPDTK